MILMVKIFSCQPPDKYDLIERAEKPKKLQTKSLIILMAFLNFSTFSAFKSKGNRW
jgi:hypothetical protein